MEEIGEIKKCVARLWRLYKKQQSLFQSAMALDLSFKLRGLFSNGYMMTLLFRKDVDLMYELLKDNLYDGDLSSIIRSNESFDPDLANQQEVLTALIAQQQNILDVYEQLLPQIDGDSEAAFYCDEHIEKLFCLEQALKKELLHHIQLEEQSRLSAA
jgi:hypothetical protein